MSSSDTSSRAGLISGGALLVSFWLLVWLLDGGACHAFEKLEGTEKAPYSAEYLNAVVNLSALRELMVLKAAILAIALGCAVVGLLGLVLRREPASAAPPAGGPVLRGDTAYVLLVALGAGLLLLSTQSKPEFKALPPVAAAGPGTSPDAGMASQGGADGGVSDGGVSDAGVPDAGAPSVDGGTPSGTPR
ncbi:hypothetical protein [Hyalangium rubrum]|uniref:Lipoprotein n=1 Tax=Hyalangium rubrum TaxID=3103134 RepID=A0ABU5H4H5_9BACT|nr:hypothetical protein [Hyalangium sp. s54d21]MDY7227713.1 hypothetical protein [Hyalangium sp. s54d21]